jgi:hypothetical protein
LKEGGFDSGLYVSGFSTVTIQLSDAFSQHARGSEPE